MSNFLSIASIKLLVFLSIIILSTYGFLNIEPPEKIVKEGIEQEKTEYVSIIAPPHKANQIKWACIPFLVENEVWDYLYYKDLIIPSVVLKNKDNSYTWYFNIKYSDKKILCNVFENGKVEIKTNYSIN